MARDEQVGENQGVALCAGCAGVAPDPNTSRLVVQCLEWLHVLPELRGIRAGPRPGGWVSGLDCL